MRFFRALGLAGLTVYAAITEIFGPAAPSATGRPGAASAADTPVRKESRLVIGTAALTVIAGMVLLIAGGVLFMLSGIYNIGADEPHFALLRWFLQTGRTRSVQFHSRGIATPKLGNPALFRNGFVLYRKNCQPCHGAPGVAAEQIGRGINPKPPPLETAASGWNDAELYWILSHGLKMSGMPGFAPRLSDENRWAIVAFLRRLSRLSPAEYRTGAAAVDQGREPETWGIDDDRGFALIRTGNPRRGRQLLRQYGCATCHAIPQIGSGNVGPPLAGFAGRQYIAGILVNVPTNAMNWIMDPKRYKPATAMPKLGVHPRDAVDIAACLYTFGSPKRIESLRQTRAR